MKTEEIRKWLKENGKDRAWLAQKCSVSKHTVDGWMAGRPIPSPSMQIIEDIMRRVPEITSKLSLEEWKAAQQAADSQGISIDAFIINAVRKAAGLGLLLICIALHIRGGR